jgi:alanyl-tRNA synthetase
VDVALTKLMDNSVREVEGLANQIIWENRPVMVRSVTREESSKLRLRKPPPGESDLLRLVEITDFDVSACGGTHVSRTGEVGLIKVIKWERRRDQVRVEFVCGARALNDYREKNRIINNLSALFTTGYWELEGSVERQMAEAVSFRRQLRQYRKSLISYQAAEMLNEAEVIRDFRVVGKVFSDLNSDELRMMANNIISSPNTIALLGSATDKLYLVFARHDDVSVDMNKSIKDAFELLGSGSGGGSAMFAQGSASEVGEKEAIEVLMTIRNRLY